MKINQNIPLLKSEVLASTAASSKSNAADGVLAARAPAVASPAKLLSSTDDFDAARVAEIRESIRAGSYEIDTAKIANGLLSSVRDLIGPPPA